MLINPNLRGLADRLVTEPSKVRTVKGQERTKTARLAGVDLILPARVHIWSDTTSALLTGL